MYLIALLFKHLFLFPMYLYYQIYDHLIYFYFRKRKLFDGWGIHLFTGKFGQGKTMLQTIKAYKIACKYPQVTIVTYYELKNFPKHTKILPLNTAQDILNAPANSLILIDEIGTLFNSRDFSSGKNSVPKPLFQHLCQVRKRRLMIYATVQRFNLLDKQIRDITATVVGTTYTNDKIYKEMRLSIMARIDKAICPSCLQEREICDFRFGIIRASLCTFCLERYLHKTVNPMLLKQNNRENDNLIEEDRGNEN